MKPTGTLTWDVADLAKGMQILDPVQYFTDGRRMSPLLECRFGMTEGLMKPKSEAAQYDLVGPDGDKWEVRAMTKHGVYFCPSAMMGSGRVFRAEKFQAKLDLLTGFIIADIVTFPLVNYWKISSGQVQGWWDDAKIGYAAKISREKMLELLDPFCENKT